jgi:hypothetical protein
MLPVVVGSHPDSPWIDDCLASILNTTDRQVVVHLDGGYEPAALRTGAALFDRFIYLQDSVTILHETFWDAIGEEPCWFAGHPPMFLGIHDALITEHLPKSVTKEEAISLEVQLPQKVNYPTIWPTVTDGAALRREMRHGRDNLVLGIPGVWEKHKGTWR